MNSLTEAVETALTPEPMSAEESLTVLEECTGAFGEITKVVGLSDYEESELEKVARCLRSTLDQVVDDLKCAGGEDVMRMLQDIGEVHG